MKRDWARNQLPSASLWNAQDVLLNYGAQVRERAGWAYQSQALSALSAGSTQVKGGVYAIFVISGTATPRNLAIDEDGALYDATTADTATSIGTALTVVQNPVFHGGTIRNGQTELTGLVIIPDGTGAAEPKVYDGSTLATMSGTPPKAKYATVYKDYTVLANGTASGTLYPNRLWFSPVGDPDCNAAASWDLTDSWLDVSLPVKSVSATRNAILVFSDTQVARIRGSVPPPDEDMVVDDPIFTVGLYDPQSIAPYKDTVIWAGPEGIFRSDAVTLDDLTKRGGMLSYWTSLTSSATSTWTFAGGIQRDTYFLSVMDGSTFKDAFAIDLQTLAWTRLTNIDALCMWNGQYGIGDELYWGRQGAPRVARLSTIYSVGSSTYKADGDGDAVTGVIETPFYPLGKGAGLKRIRRVYPTYEITDYGSDNPTATVSYVLTPEETSYTTAGTLSEATEQTRSRVEINKQGYGIGLKISRTNPGDFLFYGVEADSWEQEPSRLKQ